MDRRQQGIPGQQTGCGRHPAARAGQEGMTTLGWLFVLALIGFAATVAVKLTPVYLEHYSVKGALSGLKADAATIDGGPRGLEASLLKRLNVNSVYSVGRDDIEIKRSRVGYQVIVSYQRKVPFVANIDFLVSFHDMVEVPRN